MLKKDNKQSIAAVVVTYNRKNLLSRCLDTLLQQTIPPDSIIIIDNASTDRTLELLEKENYFKNTMIDYVRLSENSGGAGGFYEGIKRGYEKGFDWLWLMDDDGFPEKNTLEIFRLLKTSQESCYCPVVIDPLKKNHLSFGFYGFWGGEKVGFKSVEEVNDFVTSNNTRVIDGYGNFFNGVFISNEIVKNIGFPIKEMFIWGDENEYLFRILSMNFKVRIMLHAFFSTRVVNLSVSISWGKKYFILIHQQLGNIILKLETLYIPQINIVIK